MSATPAVARLPISRLWRSSRVRVWAATPAVWFVFGLLLLPYDAVRSAADGGQPARDVEGLEAALFGGTTPTLFLQSHIHGHAAGFLDALGACLHKFWFGLPVAFGLFLSLWERRRLMEFFAWVLAIGYLSDLVFVLMPVRPPWMEGGYERALLRQSFTRYTELDTNAFAAFPSMHAGLPLAMALFFLFRCQRTRKAGYAALVYSAAIGFAVVYLGEHWVVDVVGGYALAGLTALMFMHPAAARIAHRIPGDPVRALARLNDRLFPERANEPVSLGAGAAESRSRAA